MIMKECYVFEEDGRFTGQVIDMTRKPEFREIPKIRRVTPISLVLRYNVLLEAFTKTKRGWWFILLYPSEKTWHFAQNLV